MLQRRWIFRVMHIDAFIGQVIVLPRVVAILCLNIDFLIYHSFASVSLIKVLEYIADSFFCLYYCR